MAKMCRTDLKVGGWVNCKNIAQQLNHERILILQIHVLHVSAYTKGQVDAWRREGRCVLKRQNHAIFQYSTCSAYSPCLLVLNERRYEANFTKIAALRICITFFAIKPVPCTTPNSWGKCSKQLGPMLQTVGTNAANSYCRINAQIVNSNALNS